MYFKSGSKERLKLLLRVIRVNLRHLITVAKAFLISVVPNNFLIDLTEHVYIQLSHLLQYELRYGMQILILLS